MKGGDNIRIKKKSVLKAAKIAGVIAVGVAACTAIGYIMYKRGFDDGYDIGETNGIILEKYIL